jgi:hypothetical protein
MEEGVETGSDPEEKRDRAGDGEGVAMEIDLRKVGPIRRLYVVPAEGNGDALLKVDDREDQAATGYGRVAGEETLDEGDETAAGVLVEVEHEQVDAVWGKAGVEFTNQAIAGIWEAGDAAAEAELGVGAEKDAEGTKLGGGMERGIRDGGAARGWMCWSLGHGAVSRGSP